MTTRSLGTGVRFFSQRQFKTTLLGSGATSKEALGWTRAARDNGVLFDLSRAEWIDIGVAAEILLLVESAAMTGIATTIALPRGTLSEREELYLAREPDPQRTGALLRRNSRRDRTRRYLEYMAFAQALRLPHLSEEAPRPTILAAYDDSAVAPASVDSDREGYRNTLSDTTLLAEEAWGSALEEHLYLNSFPFTWLGGKELVDLADWNIFLASVLGGAERGLASLDASTLSNVILHELVENVTRYAGSSGYAIVGATARNRTLFHSPEDWLPSYQPFLQWQHDSALPFLDIVVGDSGRGIVDVLGPAYDVVRPHQMSLRDAGDARVAEWAWDRESTSDPTPGRRLTRGLYRVDRIARRYRGMVTSRTSNILVGFDHSGVRDPLVEEHERLPFMPGSLIRLTMPGYRALAAVPWPHLADEQTPKYEVVDLLEIGPRGLEEAAEQRLRSALSAARVRGHVVIGVANGGDAAGLDSTLRVAAEMRHPAALVLMGLPGSWDEVGAAVEAIRGSFGTEHRANEAFAPDHFEIWDAVPVMNVDQEVHWIAETGQQAAVLDALFYAAGHKLSPEEVLAIAGDFDASADVRRQLQHDRCVVRQDPAGGLSLQLSFDGIMKAVHEAAVVATEAFVAAAEYPPLPGMMFCTPSLEFVSRWIKGPTAIGRRDNAGLMALALAHSYRQLQIGMPSILLTETLDDPVVKALQRGLQNPNRVPIPGEVPQRASQGVRILQRGASAAVYIDILISGESARRALSEVLRDEAVPVAILCLVDARAHPGQPEHVWGRDIPVITLAVSHTHAKDAVEEHLVVPIDPITRRQERWGGTAGHLPAPVNPFEATLRTLLVANNALRLGHVKNALGNHFTFTLDSKLLIARAADVVGEELARVIAEWPQPSTTAPEGAGAARVEVWYPSPGPRGDPTVLRLAKWLSARQAIGTLGIRPIRRIEDPRTGGWRCSESSVALPPGTSVVILDWGVLSGGTIAQMVQVATASGALDVLLCIVISQLAPSQEKLFESIARVRAMRVMANGPANEDDQADLFADHTSVMSPSTGPHECNVTTRFLAHLPVRPYLGGCPVCAQLRALDENPRPELRILEAHVSATKTELADRAMDQVGEVGTRASRWVMDSAEAYWMLQFRERLDAALASTTARLSLATTLEQWSFAVSRNTQSTPTAPLDDAHDGATSCRRMLRLLHIESQWLHVAPLRLRRVRLMLGKLCMWAALAPDSSVAERAAAFFVLRATRKEDFIAHFDELMAATQGNRDLQAQLVYQAHVYVSRSYHHNVKMLAQLGAALSRLNTKITSGRVAADPQVSEGVEYLRDYVAMALAKVRAYMLSHPKAWMDLRQYVLGWTNHTPEVEACRALLLWSHERSQLEALADEPNVNIRERRLTEYGLAAQLSRFHAHFQIVASAFDREILPLLVRLREVLLSGDGTAEFSRDGRAWFWEHLYQETPLSASWLGSFARRVAADPREILDVDNADRFQQEVLALWRLVFQVELSGRRSHLAVFLAEAPSSLASAVEAAWTSASLSTNREAMARGEALRVPVRAEVNIDTTGLPDVYCPQPLLESVIRHVYENVADHQSDPSRSPQIRVRVFTSRDGVHCIVANDGTTRNTHGGRGLSLLQERLRPFGGQLQMIDPSGSFPGATFAVELILKTMGDQ